MMTAVSESSRPFAVSILNYLVTRMTLPASSAVRADATLLELARQQWLKELEKETARRMRVEDPEGFSDVQTEIRRGGMIVVEATELSQYASRVYINLAYSDKNRPARNLYAVTVDPDDFVSRSGVPYWHEPREEC